MSGRIEAVARRQLAKEEGGGDLCSPGESNPKICLGQGKWTSELRRGLSADSDCCWQTGMSCEIVKRWTDGSRAKEVY